MAFIRNCWYMVAWDHEIPADGLFGRMVIGEPLLLYRKADGDVVALEDRCCHRHAPLSVGRREGDCVRIFLHARWLSAWVSGRSSAHVLLAARQGEPLQTIGRAALYRLRESGLATTIEAAAPVRDAVETLTLELE